MRGSISYQQPSTVRGKPTGPDNRQGARKSGPSTPPEIFRPSTTTAAPYIRPGIAARRVSGTHRVTDLVAWYLDQEQRAMSARHQFRPERLQRLDEKEFPAPRTTPAQILQSG